MMLFPKSREEWLKLRVDHISSTESAALFGMSPYMTAFELAVLKKSPDAPAEYEQNERMTWGLRLQRAIAQGIAEDYGVKIRAISGYASLPDSKMGASFDYEIVGLKEATEGDHAAWECNQLLRELYKKHGPGVLEIKNVDQWIFKQEWIEGDDGLEAPAHIELQVQHQLVCIEREWAAIGVLVGGNQQHLVIRLRDREVGASITAKVGRFWKGIAGGHMPPVTLPQDADILRKLYRYAEPGSLLDFQVTDNEAIHTLARQHAEATALKSAAEKAHKSSGAALMMAIGSAEKVLFADLTVSAGMVAPTRVEAYDREGYRNLRVYPKKAEEPKS
jgi:predicted phage-related endonuclease